MEFGEALIHDLWYSTLIQCDYWCSTAMASIITKPKGSSHAIGTKRAAAFARRSFFVYD
jgi:hypothetical protein